MVTIVFLATWSLPIGGLNWTGASGASGSKSLSCGGLGLLCLFLLLVLWQISVHVLLSHANN